MAEPGGLAVRANPQRAASLGEGVLGPSRPCQYPIAVRYLTLLTLVALGLSGCGVLGTTGAEPATGWPLSEGRWDTYVGLPSADVHALAAGDDGSLWVGTSGGCVRFDGAAWEHVYTPPGGWTIRDIRLDDEGRAWLLDDRSLTVYEGGTLTTVYSTTHRLDYVSMRTLLMGSRGGVWAGGHWCSQPDEGVLLLEDEAVRYFGADDGLPSTVILDLVEDASGVIWAGGEMGAAWFDGTTWHAMVLPEQPVSQVIRTVAADPSGRIWFGTRQLGVWVWDGEAWTQYMPADGLAGDTVSAIAFDGAGRAWLGTGHGLSVFDGETWTNYTAEDGLAHNDVRALAIVRDGVWIGTWGGLNRLTFEIE